MASRRVDTNCSDPLLRTTFLVDPHLRIPHGGLAQSAGKYQKPVCLRSCPSTSPGREREALRSDCDEKSLALLSLDAQQKQPRTLA